MFGDKLGRRKMMFTGATVLTLGVVIQVTCFGGSWAGVFLSLHSILLPLLIFLIQVDNSLSDVSLLDLELVS